MRLYEKHVADKQCSVFIVTAKATFCLNQGFRVSVVMRAILSVTCATRQSIPG